MVGGYITYDTKGMPLNEGESVHKNGLYADALRLVAANKPIFLKNCSWKEGNVRHYFTPIQASAIILSSGVIMFSAETLQVFVYETDDYDVQQL